MTKSSETDFDLRFDRALVHRDLGENDKALLLLDELVTSIKSSGPTDRQSRRILIHSHMQIGYLHGLSGDQISRERHFRAATELAPRLELASLGLFHSLWELSRHEDALREIVRYVEHKNSDGYRELLSEGFGADLPTAQARLADEARELLRRRSPEE
jgi:tetratricopeptide (TPR) repeat protein